MAAWFTREVARLYTDLWKQKHTTQRRISRQILALALLLVGGRIHAQPAPPLSFTYQNPIDFSFPYYDGTKERKISELNGFDNLFFEIQNEPWADNHAVGIFQLRRVCAYLTAHGKAALSQLVSSCLLLALYHPTPRQDQDTCVQGTGLTRVQDDSAHEALILLKRIAKRPDAARVGTGHGAAGLDFHGD